MALLENLVAGNVYIVKIAASNEVGEGPFSNAVELAVLPKESSESNQRPKRLDSADADTGEHKLWGCSPNPILNVMCLDVSFPEKGRWNIVNSFLKAE